MQGRHVVVDGSNIATEGRNLPSLAQLDQAVREFLVEYPDDTVTVVVDASFAHRIDPSEVKAFEDAEAANEVVSPPAGAIGRGDAFLLRIADKTGATILSNDSFQEFHGEYEWLFNNGRLIGGKPVPGVGWIFTPRTPVRGPKSREAVKEAKRKRQPEPADASGLDLAAARGRGQGPRRGKKVAAAIATATEEAVGADDAKRRRRRKAGEPPAEPVNEPLAFITFIAAHPLGSEVAGSVDSFSSHGAFVLVDGTRCYLPLSAMGEPPPRSAREVLAKGEGATFVVQALDPLRRGVELAIPGFAKLAGGPTEETVEAEIAGGDGGPDARVDAVLEAAPAIDAPRAGRARRRTTAAPPASGTQAATAPELRADPAPAGPLPPETDATTGPPPPEAPAVTPAKRTRARKVPAEKAPATKAAAPEATASKTPAKQAAPAKRAAPAKQAPPAKRAAPAKKAPSAKRAPPAKQAPPADPAAPAKQAPSAKRAAPAKKAPPADQAAPAKKAPSATRAAPAKEAPPAKQTAAKKPPAKQTAAKKPPAKKPPAKRAGAAGSPAAGTPSVTPAGAGRTRRPPRQVAAATAEQRGTTGRAS